MSVVNKVFSRQNCDEICWDTRTVFIVDAYLEALINQNVDNIIVVTDRGRFTASVDDVLDQSTWSTNSVRTLPFSRWAKG